MIYVSFSTIYTACLTESRQKSRVLCAVFVLFFLFYAVFIEHQINTILYGKPTVGSCTGFAESKLPSYENFRFCLCGGKKKDGLILKSQSFMKYDKCH